MKLDRQKTAEEYPEKLLETVVEFRDIRLFRQAIDILGLGGREVNEQGDPYLISKEREMKTVSSVSPG